MEEKIKKQISKLLALSTSPNEHEAHSALKKAQELAAKHGLELESLDEKKEVEVANLYSGGKLSPEVVDIASAIDEYYRVKALIRNNRVTHYKTLIVVGLEQDNYIFKQVLSYTVAIMNVMFKDFLLKYKKDHPHVPSSRSFSIRLKRDYIKGFILGVADALHKNANEKALALYVPKEVSDYMKEQMKITDFSTTRVSAHSAAAVFAGKSDGFDAMDNKRNKAIA